jgi:hypothetical protein
MRKKSNQIKRCINNNIIKYKKSKHQLISDHNLPIHFSFHLVSFEKQQQQRKKQTRLSLSN